MTRNEYYKDCLEKKIENSVDGEFAFKILPKGAPLVEERWFIIQYYADNDFTINDRWDRKFHMRLHSIYEVADFLASVYMGEDYRPQLHAEWIPYMKSYRIYDPHYPQQTCAYIDDFEEAVARVAEDGYDLALCDIDTMHVELDKDGNEE